MTIFIKENQLNKYEKQENMISYKTMIDTLTDGEYILNNFLLKVAVENNMDYEIYNYCPEDDEDELPEIFQYFIISEYDSGRILENTDEIIISIPDMDIYLLCVTHYGTGWDCVYGMDLSDSRIELI